MVSTRRKPRSKATTRKAATTAQAETSSPPVSSQPEATIVSNASDNNVSDNKPKVRKKLKPVQTKRGWLMTRRSRQVYKTSFHTGVLYIDAQTHRCEYVWTK